MRFLETFTLLTVLITALWNALRAWTALTWRGALTEFIGANFVWILFFGGAVWALAGFSLALALLTRRAWARRALAALSIAYSVWYWAERLLFELPRPNWVFAAIVNFILLAFVMTNVKLMTREAYERKIERSKTA